MKPGILIVTLHEGKGFSLSPHYQQIFTSHFQNSSSPAIRPSSSSSHSSHTANSHAHAGRPQSTNSGINAAPTIHGRYSTKYLPYALLDFDKNQVFVDAVSGTPENPLWAGDNTSFKFDVSRQTELSVQLYLRNPAARPGAGRSEDIFLGAVKVNPRFEEAAQPYVEDPKLSKKDNQKAAAAHAEQERHMGQLGAEWLDLQFGTGSIKIGVSFVENKQRSMKLEDFELLKVVGKGSFGKVMQVMYGFSRKLSSFACRLILTISTGRKILAGSMPSRRSARLTSFPVPKSPTLWRRDPCLHRSTTLSLFL